MGCKPVILGLLISFGLLADICFGKYSGGTGEPNEPYLIETPNDLNSIGLDPYDWDKHFLLTADINLSGFTGTEFSIIGKGGDSFTGVFDGNGYTISNFTYSSAEAFDIGLFGAVDGEVRDLGLIDPNVGAGTGSYVGSLVGALYHGTVRNCFAEGGVVSGGSMVGGLVGKNLGGEITSCYAIGVVTASRGGIGGLVGGNLGDISNCYSAGSVLGLEEGWIEYVGGLAGFNGSSRALGTISDSYSLASVSGTEKIGGLVGQNGECGTITNSYSSGNVSGTYGVGGLVGANYDSVTNSFWDIETSDCNVSAGGIGLPTRQMQRRSTFADAGWDFVSETANGYEDIWRMCVDGVNYPKLSWKFLGYGDFTCPDGVDFIDYSILANEWRLERLEQDYNSDGRVNFKDWAIFANNWEGSYTELPPFLACWLGRSAHIADIAPTGGDDFVDWQDLAILVGHWLDEK